MKRRSLHELVDVDEPGIDLIREWLQSAENSVAVLQDDAESGRRILLASSATDPNLGLE